MAVKGVRNSLTRPELTFKHNLLSGRHGWLRLTPAYSVRLVERILAQHPERGSILDPFSGTGTTALCASARGLTAASVDINPFLVWLGTAKTAVYDDETLHRARQAAGETASLIEKKQVKPAEPPPISNIGRWWGEGCLSYLCYLKAAIAGRTEPDSHVRNLLYVAFCRTLIQLSNAAFNHQSMSFKRAVGEDQSRLWSDAAWQRMVFESNCATVLNSAAQNPVAEARFILGDAREIDKCLNTAYDLVVTSPPYPNRVSYIRELRPYMYWLGYLRDPRQAGELDCRAVGGTWGVATSRLAQWDRTQSSYLPSFLRQLISKVERANRKSGHLLANYIAKYFDDVWKHVRAIRSVLESGATVHYIVGNAKFYDTLVPTERLYADILAEAGFKKPQITLVRKRNSKKELFEFDVSAVLP